MISPAHRSKDARLLILVVVVVAFIALPAAGCRDGGVGRKPKNTAGAQPPREVPVQQKAETVTPRDSFFFLPVAASALRLFWKDSAGKIFGSLGAVKRSVEARGGRLGIAMNGGMYTEDQGPLGLFIQEGKTLRRLNRDTGYGNFYLRPNGVFFITDEGRPGVCRTQDFPKQKNVRFATQSGPMLLVEGRMHRAFKKGSSNLNIRNGVGITLGGQPVLGISRVPVSFWDFAEAFRRRGCGNALYLDGAVSRMYWPEAGLADTGGAFGVIIGVVNEP